MSKHDDIAWGVDHFTPRFPELLALVNACETRRELNALNRRFLNQLDREYDGDTSVPEEAPACEGALFAFVTARREVFKERIACSRLTSETQDDLRVDRILRIRDSSGKAHARKNG